MLEHSMHFRLKLVVPCVMRGELDAKVRSELVPVYYVCMYVCMY